ncbi:heptaprenyl diphosphate synthase component I [bacterium BMS3Abin09]|nr:heptaprenyl diphosphate synthase component I [bacterium BMS3Abin09]GBE40529.1 heptaprenyl diphosphate synthase component I [bacterium BMS3Bbin09]HDN95097.1 Gx transporter family protein [Nitrospirota bacterium]HDO67226.1 Gx transporter family protein [Nitrospirota bacterium]HEW81400.1 Gx transporter family protein [Nitrospirota bacterium]
MNKINGTAPFIDEKRRSEAIHIALLSAYAVGLHSIEAFIPTPVPWLRLGLANIITLLTLYLYGLRAGMIVTLTRVIVRSLIAGTFLGPAFVMSIGGGVASTLVMWAMYSVFRRQMNIVILSVFGALTHNIVQLFLAYFLFVRRIEAILIVSPIILFFGVITGIFNGIITNMIIKKIKIKKEAAVS